MLFLWREPSPLPLATPVTVSNEKAGANSNRETGRGKFIATNIFHERIISLRSLQQFEPPLTLGGV